MKKLLQLDVVTLHAEDALQFLVLQEESSCMPTWPPCNRKHLAGFLHNPEFSSRNLTLSTALCLPLAMWDQFPQFLPLTSSCVGNIPAPLISTKGFIALHGLFSSDRYLFYCTVKVINESRIKYDLYLYSSRAQNDSSGFVIIPFRKQRLRRSGRTELWMVAPRLKWHSHEWDAVD